MKLPLSVAQKLLQLLDGCALPAAQLRHAIVDKMVDDGIIRKERVGSNRNIFHLGQQAGLQAYLHNHFGIADLSAYVANYNNEELTRAEAINLSSDSKLKAIRTFKGFLVNSFEPIQALLNGHNFTIHPPSGTFQFIYDFEDFLLPADVLIVGIENPENFRWIVLQRHLFGPGKCLFISRYPQSQSGDVIRWLKDLANHYLHYGDFDFEGINIYLREYKKHLGERASFFIPEGLPALLSVKGNRERYNKQLHHQPDLSVISETSIRQLIALLHQHKKILEQEALISH